MKNVTIGDLSLYLRDLLENHGDVLRASATGKLYEPRLRAKKEAIEALPEGVLSRSPFAEELSAEDVTHDGVGSAVFHLCEAILLHPRLPAHVKQTAETVRATFIADPAELRRSYADEAATALTNRPKLARHKAALKAVQVPGGGSLFDWVKAFLDSGDAIDGLLRKRAAALATAQDGSGTGALQASTVGLLSRFREALRDELTDEGSKLPADHEAQLFSYLDKLSADRAAQAARRAGTGAGAQGGEDTASNGATGEVVTTEMPAAPMVG
jgi:hypothetical protein